MAFRVLNDIELSLLSEDQRVQYERELRKYNERIAFVDCLDKLENVRFEPFEPQFQDIHVTKAEKANEFKTPEYEYVQMPETPEINAVQLSGVRSDDLVKSDIMPTSRPQAVSIEFEELSFEKVGIIPIADKHIPRVSFKPSNIEYNGLPSFSKSSFEPLQFKVPTVRSVSVADIRKPDGISLEFKKPDKKFRAFPVLAKPSTNINTTFKKDDGESVCYFEKLPDIKVSKHNAFAFKPISINRLDILNAEKPTAPQISFIEPKSTKISFRALPSIGERISISSAECQFITPFISHINKTNCNKIQFKAPERKEASVPKLDLPTVKRIEFKKPDLYFDSIRKHSVQRLTVRRFEKPYYNPTEIQPIISAKRSSLIFRHPTVMMEELQRIQTPRVVQLGLKTNELQVRQVQPLAAFTSKVIGFEKPVYRKISLRPINITNNNRLMPDIPDLTMVSFRIIPKMKKTTLLFAGITEETTPIKSIPRPHTSVSFAIPQVRLQSIPSIKIVKAHTDLSELKALLLSVV